MLFSTINILDLLFNNYQGSASMKKLYDRFERKILIGNRKLQWLFESLHRFSLRGMNFDQVQSIETSGELYVIVLLRKKLAIKKS